MRAAHWGGPLSPLLSNIFLDELDTLGLFALWCENQFDGLNVSEETVFSTTRGGIDNNFKAPTAVVALQPQSCESPRCCGRDHRWCHPRPNQSFDRTIEVH